MSVLALLASLMFGEDLRDFCARDDPTICFFYVSGALDMVEATRGCETHIGMSQTDDILAIMRGWLAENPDKDHLTPAQMVALAFGEATGCPELRD